MAVKINEQTQEAVPSLDALIPIANPDGLGGYNGRSMLISSILDTLGGSVFSGFFMQKTIVAASETITIPVDHQMIVANNLIIDGAVIADGDLVIF